MTRFRVSVALCIVLMNEGVVPGAGVPNVGIRSLVINRFLGAGIRVLGPGGAGFPGHITVDLGFLVTLARAA